MTDFDKERPRLTALATRILGSRADADDIVQEAWLRFFRTDGIDNLSAWLNTTVTRLCIDHLRKSQVRSQADSKPSDGRSTMDPEADALLAEQVGDAMQVVFEALAPAERAAFVLHDVFGFSFDEISAIMGRSEVAVRQLASRARRKVQGIAEPKDPQRALEENQRVVGAFLRAARGGDMMTLLSLLAPHAVMRADLVAQKMGTDALYDGPSAVASRFNGTRGAVPVSIDGELGAAWIHARSIKVAFIFHVESNQIYEVELIADPEVLAALEVVRIRLKS